MTADNDKVWKGEVIATLANIRAGVEDMGRKLDKHIDTVYIQTKHCMERFAKDEGVLCGLRGAMARMYKLVIGVAVLVLAAGALTAMIRS